MFFHILVHKLKSWIQAVSPPSTAICRTITQLSLSSWDPAYLWGHYIWLFCTLYTLLNTGLLHPKQQLPFQQIKHSFKVIEDCGYLLQRTVWLMSKLSFDYFHCNFLLIIHFSPSLTFNELGTSRFNVHILKAPEIWIYESILWLSLRVYIETLYSLWDENLHCSTDRAAVWSSAFVVIAGRELLFLSNLHFILKHTYWHSLALWPAAACSGYSPSVLLFVITVWCL